MKKLESNSRQNRSSESMNTLKMVKRHNTANSTTPGVATKISALKLKAIFSNNCQSREEARKFLRSHPSTIPCTKQWKGNHNSPRWQPRPAVFPISWKDPLVITTETKRSWWPILAVPSGANCMLWLCKGQVPGSQSNLYTKKASTKDIAKRCTKAVP